MRASHLGGLCGVLIGLAVLLTGCSLLFQDENQPNTGAEGLMTADRWVIAAQGEEEPAACEQDLSRSEARQEAKEALKEEEEAQQLQQVLASWGKRLMVWRAKGCEVNTEEDESGSDPSGQGLFGQQAEGPETVLVEVPAGPDAALYLVETNDEEGNYWISLKESVEGGERLIHLEVGLEGEAEVQGLGEGIGQVSFFLPDEEGTQEIVKQVQELLEGSGTGTESAGLRAMSAEELDWARAEVLILEGDSEEAEALLVVPAVEAEGQRLWGRSRPRIDVDRALFAKVRVKKSVANKRMSYTLAQPKKSKPVVKRGSALKRAFRYCPYRYYGRLSPFRRALCQDSWERWYRKQWRKGRVIDTSLNVYRPLVLQPSRKEVYLTTYVRDDRRNLEVMLGGLENLDQTSLDRCTG